MNEDVFKKLFGQERGARTELSRRREQLQRDQRRMFGDVDPQGRKY